MLSEKYLLDNIKQHRDDCKDKYFEYIDIVENQDLEDSAVLMKLVQLLISCQDDLQKALYNYDLLTGNFSEDLEKISEE